MVLEPVFDERGAVKGVIGYAVCKNAPPLAALDASQGKRPALLVCTPSANVVCATPEFLALWRLEHLQAPLDGAAMLREAAFAMAEQPKEFIKRIAEILAQSQPVAEYVRLRGGRVLYAYAHPTIAEDGTPIFWTWYYREVAHGILSADPEMPAQRIA
jgi:hypothetical protein